MNEAHGSLTTNLTAHPNRHPNLFPLCPLLLGQEAGVGIGWGDNSCSPSALGPLP